MRTFPIATIILELNQLIVFLEAGLQNSLESTTFLGLSIQAENAQVFFSGNNEEVSNKFIISVPF